MTLRWPHIVVVAVVLGMPLALGAVALNQFRQQARTRQCLNDARQIGMALTVFEQAKQRFPGYTERVGPHRVTWSVAVLPMLERTDAYGLWLESPAGSPPKSPYIDTFVCPQDPPPDIQSPWTSYVANAGRAGKRDERLGQGVLFNFFPDPNQPSLRGLAIMSVHIKDGATNTLLLSENVQATTWNDLSNGMEKIATVFVWHPTKSPKPVHQINGELATATLNEDAARPSSFHGRGVNVVYADAHSSWLSENIDYTLYQRLMTTSDADAGLKTP